MKFTPLILFVLCILLYANTLQHGFVLDDEVVLSQNAYVQQGTGGISKILSEDSFAGYLQSRGVNDQIITGGRYRPLSLVFFAVWVEFISNQPFIFHLFNVLLFAGCMLFFYKAVQDICKQRLSGNWPAIVAASLFAVHPIHTEVVANVKSADELLSFLLGILAFRLGIQPDFSFKKQAAVAVLLLLSCLSKETGAVWLALIPMARWVLYPEKPLSLLLKSAVPFLGILCYLLLRINATGTDTAGAMMQDPMNNPFVMPGKGEWVATVAPGADTLPVPHMQWRGSLARFATPAEKSATIVYTLGRYAQLMLFPYPLTHDYYPCHITLKNWHDPMIWLVSTVIGGMLFWAFRGGWKKSVASFGGIWFLLALLPVLNVFFPVGVFMAERFLLLPSAGFCMVIAGALMLKSGDIAVWQKATLVAVCCGLGIYTFTRNTAWSSNEHLFATDILHSPESAKLEFNLGNTLLTKALAEKDSMVRVQHIRGTIPYFEKAVAVHPFYYNAWQGVGASHFFTGNYEKAIQAYTIAAMLKPNDPLTLDNIKATQNVFNAAHHKDNQPPASK